MNRFYAIAAASAVLLGCSEPASVVISDSDRASGFDSDQERIIYALGVAVGENIAEFRLSDDELAIVAAGMRDVMHDDEYQVDMELYGPQIQTLANERMMAGVSVEKEAAAAFAAEIAAEPGAEQFESGLIVVPITEGDGANPTAADTVTVHYTGTLRDGSVFDSSVERDEPATFPLNQVIPCWTEGVQKIKVGGSAKLLCPSDIAYGDQGRPPQIPGGAALLFEVELLGIPE